MPKSFQHTTAFASRIASALLASLALALLCVLPRPAGFAIILSRPQLLPRAISLAEALLKARQSHRHSPAGPLQIGSLSNAGGLPFPA
jgi:hypothetical protein